MPSEQQTASTSYIPSEALANGQTHYWQVRAVDGDGQSGAWSGIYSLAVNWGRISGQSPANGASTADTTPALSWSAVSDAAHYEVRIAGDENGLAGAAEQQTAAPATFLRSSGQWANPLLAGAGVGWGWSKRSLEHGPHSDGELGDDQRPESPRIERAPPISLRS